MIRSTEIELHARAQKLFEQENPGRVWRLSTKSQFGESAPERIANLTERQTYLAHVRNRMRQEGASLKWTSVQHSLEPAGDTSGCNENPPRIAPGGSR